MKDLQGKVQVRKAPFLVVVVAFLFVFLRDRPLSGVVATCGQSETQSSPVQSHSETLKSAADISLCDCHCQADSASHGVGQVSFLSTKEFQLSTKNRLH